MSRLSLKKFCKLELSFMSESNSTPFQKLIILVMVLLFIIDLVFILGKFLPDVLRNQIEPIYLELLANKGFMIVLEFLAVLSLVIDVINRFDVFTKTSKTIRCALTALFVIVFFAKVFVMYIDSALLTS